ncbi:MAG: hypothetical protein J0G30_09710 [Actinomycetales bacterium]|nr:hypothetical protein [Actinomycetales bacterium]
MSTMAAPTIAPGATPTVTPTALACPRCATVAVAGEPFCAHCGARVPFARPGRAPAAPSATRALVWALLLVAVNAIVGGGALAALWLVGDAAQLSQAGLALELVRLVVVGGLALVTVRLGLRGLRETADGRLARRGWAILALVISSSIALLTAVSVLATALLALR